MPGHASATDAYNERIRPVVRWLTATGLFMENLHATILNTAAPAISKDFGVAALRLKSVLTTYTLSLAVFIPISGSMADRFGTSRVFRVAVALFARSWFYGRETPPMRANTLSGRSEVRVGGRARAV